MNRYQLSGLVLITVLAGCRYVDESATPPASVDTGKQAPPKSGEAVVEVETREGFTRTDSGLQYRITREGNGKKPTVVDTVTVHYRGQLVDGTEFDSSYKRNEPSTFALGGVIAGWTEGLQLVSEGGMIELVIPSNLAYGPSGRPGIPPNATLEFVVELKKIN